MQCANTLDLMLFLISTSILLPFNAVLSKCARRANILDFTLLKIHALFKFSLLSNLTLFNDIFYRLV